ncbi:hypothetical protein E2I00_015842 [Balaenoptera physalus]|uniref:Ig-like domain-containing protein n=1 Tax=Balaenoptera physalus TaxID=9770 RepID=A0A6A1QCK3_BALPH|nr:hypothetical protein E2I00_015842 [Balaenoptera physalus]
MCWGRGACPLTRCGSNIIWTNGYSVTFQKDKRYKLNGNIGGGDVSLTIENAAQADSGLYCCRVEKRGSTYDNNNDDYYSNNDHHYYYSSNYHHYYYYHSTNYHHYYSTTDDDHYFSTTNDDHYCSTTNYHHYYYSTNNDHHYYYSTNYHYYYSTNNYHYYYSTTNDDHYCSTNNNDGHHCSNDNEGLYLCSSSASTHKEPPASSFFIFSNADSRNPAYHTARNKYNRLTIALLLNRWVRHCDPPVMLAQDPWMSTNKGVYIGICVTALVLLLTFLVFTISKRYFCLGNKVELLRVIPLRDSHIGALKNAALKPVRAEDNIYIIDDLH